MDAKTLYGAMACVSEVMRENRDYLIGLDQQNGDSNSCIKWHCRIFN